MIIDSIAIDGPAGAGKSTIAKKVAAALGFSYVDTGALYRAMAYYLLRQGIDPADSVAIDEACGRAEIDVHYKDGQQIITLEGEPVNAYLRTEEVGNMASVSSARMPVREALLALQKALAARGGVVMDGRDIGTVIMPEAILKVYLTADSHVRALRRTKELTEKGVACDLDEIEREIIRRDKRDMSREFSPLTRAEDAELVDSSDMDIQEVTETILGLYRAHKSAQMN